MRTALINGRVLLPTGFEENVAVLLEGNRIFDVVSQKDFSSEYDVHDLRGTLLLPGFIDVQVNGGGGVLFNDVGTTASTAFIDANLSPGTQYYYRVYACSGSLVSQFTGSALSAVTSPPPGYVTVSLLGSVHGSGNAFSSSVAGSR